MDGGTAKVVECPITQLLEKLGEPVIDPVIIEYLNGILSNGESLESYDESAMQAELREALCTFSANFAALTDVEQMACCTDLVQRWVVTSESCRIVETKDDQSCECTESSGKDQRESIKALHGSPVDDPSLSMLSSISPRSLPEKFLHHLLYDHCHGDVQAAANLILTDEQGIDMLLTSWTMKFQDSHAQMESPIDKASRQAILHKYQLEAIPDDTATKSKPQAPVPLDWRRSSKKGGEEDKTQKAKAVRYRDGAIVSTKGEKYIVEKPEEWDGGSRGKVKSKRKGGVGWR